MPALRADRRGARRAVLPEDRHRGADLLCLAALHRLDELPRFVSIEISASEPFRELCLLRALGYDGFKLVNQALNETIELPRPAREGEYVPYRFDGHSSGPFGEETSGSWLGFEQAFERLRAVLRDYRLDRRGPAGFAASLARRWRRERRTGPPGSWHDLHARRGA